jgi:hypothetical protein
MANEVLQGGAKLNYFPLAFNFTMIESAMFLSNKLRFLTNELESADEGSRGLLR